VFGWGGQTETTDMGGVKNHQSASYEKLKRERGIILGGQVKEVKVFMCIAVVCVSG